MQDHRLAHASAINVGVSGAAAHGRNRRCGL